MCKISDKSNKFLLNWGSTFSGHCVVVIVIVMVMVSRALNAIR